MKLKYTGKELSKFKEIMKCFNIIDNAILQQFVLHVKNIQFSTLTTLRDIYFETNFYHPSSI